MSATITARRKIRLVHLTTFRKNNSARIEKAALSNSTRIRKRQKTFLRKLRYLLRAKCSSELMAARSECEKVENRIREVSDYKNPHTQINSQNALQTNSLILLCSVWTKKQFN